MNFIRALEKLSLKFIYIKYCNQKSNLKSSHLSSQLPRIKQVDKFFSQKLVRIQPSVTNEGKLISVTI